MNKKMLKPLCVALLSAGLVTAGPLLAETAAETAAKAAEKSVASTAAPEKPEQRSEASESVQPQVEKQTADTSAEKRKKIIEEAIAAIDQTKKALKALDEKKTEEALKALEIATGKLELILAREPKLALATVDVEVITQDLLAQPETIEKMIGEARKHLDEGKVQEARALIAGLGSEIVFRSTSIPLATYPAAIKAVTPLIDQGKIDEAKALLEEALGTLVITDEVVPLPILRAQHLLLRAEKLAENKERTDKENETLKQLLDETRNQLRMGELLGYGSRETYKGLYQKLDTIVEKTAGGKGGTGWFDSIKKQLSELF